MAIIFSQMQNKKLSIEEYSRFLLLCLLDEGTNCDLHTFLEDDLKEESARQLVYSYLKNIASGNCIADIETSGSVTENSYLIALNPNFKKQYRCAIRKASNGDQEALHEQHLLINMLTNRINAHLGDGMDKPKGIKKGIIY